MQEARDIEYLNLGDSRMICSKCCSIAIKDSEEFKPIIENVHNFYESLNLKFGREVPILLVDGSEMRRSRGNYKLIEYYLGVAITKKLAMVFLCKLFISIFFFKFYTAATMQANWFSVFAIRRN